MNRIESNRIFKDERENKTHNRETTKKPTIEKLQKNPRLENYKKTHDWKITKSLFSSLGFIFFKL